MLRNQDQAMPIPFKIVLIFLVLVLNLVKNASAVELPSVADFTLKYQNSIRSIEVVEPHESTAERSVSVKYKAVPIADLLTDLFAQRWISDDSRIIFYAKDGYRTVIAKTKLDKFKAYLAFARDDGQPFWVDNIAQGEKYVSLAPYYLIWDNKDSVELRHRGAYGWPYQVTRIELQKMADNTVLFPQSSNGFSQGMRETEEYCLTCHTIKGVGGQKYSTDLLQASCRLNEQTLKKWIAMPSVVKPGTSMPALNGNLPRQERQAVIDRIVAYLKAMRSEPNFVCKSE